MNTKMNLSTTTRRPSSWRWLVIGLLTLAGLVSVPAARADVSCQASASYPAVENTVTLAGSFYAGNDLPNGTLLYQVNLTNGPSVGLHCSGDYSGIPFMNKVRDEPMGPPASLPVNGLTGSGYVYPTNINGVGVVFWAYWQGNNSFSADQPVENGGDFSGNTTTDNGKGFVIRMGLVKTGFIASGSDVLGSSLPTVIAYADATPGYTGLPLTLATLHLQGNIHFITSTCQTPDVTVPMGTYEITKYFRGVGSTTPWVDASIQLQNCPTFTGFYGNYSNPNSGQNASGSTTPSGGTLTANLLKVSLQPATDIVDSASGVLKVNANGSSGSPATGVGIQLGYTPDNINASPTAPTAVWKEGDTWSVTPPNDGTANFRIPLAARYYQYDKAVTPGPANAQVTFVIDYN